jgi:hypothetical protein
MTMIAARRYPMYGMVPNSAVFVPKTISFPSVHYTVCNATGEGSAGLVRSFSDMWYSKLDPFIADLSDEQIEKLG